MKWTEITVHAAQETVEAISYLLNEQGAEGVTIEDPEVLSREWDSPYGEILQLSADDYPEEGVRLKGYFYLENTADSIIASLHESIEELKAMGLDVGAATISTRVVDDEDWSTAWKKYYKPVSVSSRITVCPSWEEYSPRPDEVMLYLDPGMAFGTGTHATTVLCLRALEKVLSGGEKVLDVGCGTGVLSIAAAKLGAESVLAIDLDPVAVDSAKLNVELNRVVDRVEVRQNDLVTDLNGPYDVVVANILAEVLVTFPHEVYERLKPGGIYITSGIIQSKADMVKAALDKAGLPVEETFHEEDWVAFLSKKV